MRRFVGGVQINQNRKKIPEKLECSIGNFNCAPYDGGTGKCCFICEELSTCYPTWPGGKNCRYYGDQKKWCDHVQDWVKEHGLP